MKIMYRRLKEWHDFLLWTQKLEGRSHRVKKINDTQKPITQSFHMK